MTAETEAMEVDTEETPKKKKKKKKSAQVEEEPSEEAAVEEVSYKFYLLSNFCLLGCRREP